MTTSVFLIPARLRIYDHEEFSDILLVIPVQPDHESIQIYAHKAILASRSTKFQAELRQSKYTVRKHSVRSSPVFTDLVVGEIEFQVGD